MTSIADQLWQDVGAPLSKELFGVPVQLKRAGVLSNVITAIADQVTYQVIDQEGFLTSYTSRDYTLPVAEVIWNGEVKEPRKGDIVVETINGVVSEFEITPMAKNSATSLKPNGFDWLVHTTQVL